MKAVAIQVGTSIPDEIKIVIALGTAYVMFPSVPAASKVLLHLQGKLLIGHSLLPIDFTPTGLARNSSPSQGNNVNFVQDWYCDKCEFKNFARRVKCKMCENGRNHNCRVVFNSTSIIKHVPSSSGTTVQHYWYIYRTARLASKPLTMATTAT